VGSIDRTLWPPGPWDGEPDSLDWVSVGLPLDGSMQRVPCALRRSSASGVWCGYINVPHSHPWARGRRLEHDDVQVHGGVTSEHMHDEGFTVGFDCGHYGDYAPALEAAVNAACGRDLVKEYVESSEHGVYRTMDYARRETEKLAEQARAAARGALGQAVVEEIREAKE